MRKLSRGEIRLFSRVVVQRQDGPWRIELMQQTHESGFRVEFALVAQEIEPARADSDVTDFVAQLFAAAGLSQTAARRVGEALVEADFVSRSGKLTRFLMSGTRIRCEGEPYVCGMGLDMTRRHQQENLLRLRERALHAASNGIIIRCSIARLHASREHMECDTILVCVEIINVNIHAKTCLLCALHIHCR